MAHKELRKQEISALKKQKVSNLVIEVRRYVDLWVETFGPRIMTIIVEEVIPHAEKWEEVLRKIVSDAIKRSRFSVSQSTTKEA